MGRFERGRWARWTAELTNLTRNFYQVTVHGVGHIEGVEPRSPMKPVRKALWFIESHFAGEITLDDVAGVAGVSRYYLTRAFGGVPGHPVMRYVRGRRLTEAARSLANGARHILPGALDAGYGSHEAFTRAFHEQFGVTPE